MVPSSSVTSSEGDGWARSCDSNASLYGGSFDMQFKMICFQVKMSRTFKKESAQQQENLCKSLFLVMRPLGHCQGL